MPRRSSRGRPDAADRAAKWGLIITPERIIEGIFGPYGAAFLILVGAVLFSMKVVVPGSWWRTERDARLRLKAKYNRLVIAYAKANGVTDSVIDVLYQDASEPDLGELP